MKKAETAESLPDSDSASQPNWANVKIIIAGSRQSLKFKADASLIDRLIHQSGFEPSLIVCGCAAGADVLGHEWAKENRVPVEYFPAWEGQFDWALRNRMLGELIHEIPSCIRIQHAGPIRNASMGKFADALIAIWDGESHGTQNMIDTMRGANKPLVWVNLSLSTEIAGRHVPTGPDICTVCHRHNEPGSGPCLDGTQHTFEFVIRRAIPGSRKDVPSLSR